MKNLIEKWQFLFSELEIIDEDSEVLTEEELQEFENDKDVVLPLEYKIFCQVFGTGLFGDFVFVAAPSNEFYKFSEVAVNGIRNELKFFPSRDLSRDKALEDLLDSAFVFGGDSVWGNLGFWDLRTYSELDQSYDIYWIGADLMDEDACLIGRNFFDFVQGFCLGTTAYDVLPGSKQPDSKTIYNTFTRSAWKG